MALVTITLTTFLTGTVAPDQFAQQVGESTIGPQLLTDGITCDFANAFLEFTAPLTPAELTTLQALAAAHTATGRLTVGPVATLPTGLFEDEDGFATDGRKVSEGAGSGTGVPIYWSTGAWRVFSSDAPVQS